MLNVRKLAAIDLQFLGSTIILTEFGLGVVGATALGVITVRAGIERFHSRRMIAFGVYLLLLGLNYLPLLLHAISMARDKSAHEELAGELGDKPAAFRKYRRQSLLLLLPLVVPVLAILQLGPRRPTAQPGN